ncbi:hypothetical protein GCM10010384_68080 [Streptomyces djakartensis]|uniref:SCP domain-containing protein n=1 Tax=Streptomyces djakartensis TaxID=68193 RepID=A0ABQ3AJ67_9ACTN|nr:hypothetical protein GCM10010384_68080 [Streptomyces djakartensis]
MLLALAVALAAGPDDPPVLIALEVDLAFAAGERAGGEPLDQALIVAAQALEHERLEARGATRSVGSSPGSRKTGTMIRATLVEPSLGAAWWAASYLTGAGELNENCTGARGHVRGAGLTCGNNVSHHPFEVRLENWVGG